MQPDIALLGKPCDGVVRDTLLGASNTSPKRGSKHKDEQLEQPGWKLGHHTVMKLMVARNNLALHPY